MRFVVAPVECRPGPLFSLVCSKIRSKLDSHEFRTPWMRGRDWPTPHRGEAIQGWSRNLPTARVPQGATWRCKRATGRRPERPLSKLLSR